MVSACLAGFHCRYDGKSNRLPEIVALVTSGQALPFCPERLGGLTTPRKSVERVGTQCLSVDGEDFTEAFVRGAQEMLTLCQVFDCKKAILKSKSPSCGLGSIYDGSFSGKITEGKGVTADLLLKNGIEVMSDEDFIKAKIKF